MTEAYQRRMCDLVDSSVRPFRSREPVVCLIAKSLRRNRGTTPPDGVSRGPSRDRMQTQDRPGIMFRN
jgi:hypothetical protein